jgi:hypothetical protein
MILNQPLSTKFENHGIKHRCMGVVSANFLLCICCKLVVLKVSGIWTMRPICLFLYYVCFLIWPMAVSVLCLFMDYGCLWTIFLESGLVFGLYISVMVVPLCGNYMNYILNL